MIASQPRALYYSVGLGFSIFFFCAKFIGQQIKLSCMKLKE
jgi:hypothetical protein